MADAIETKKNLAQKYIEKRLHYKLIPNGIIKEEDVSPWVMKQLVTLYLKDLHLVNNLIDHLNLTYCPLFASSPPQKPTKKELIKTVNTYVREHESNPEADPHASQPGYRR